VNLRYHASLVLSCLTSLAHAEISIPAYSDPDSRIVEFSEEKSLGGWKNAKQRISWFGGQNGRQQHKAFYGPQWFANADGKWTELTTTKFSHDPSGKSHRLDRFRGGENGEFFLSQGGFVEGFTKYGELFTRPATNTPPDFQLP
jgi:hypothetical protein